ncbi:MAG: membrane protein insertase YidC, partial [Kofleriaceae bacterium]
METQGKRLLLAVALAFAVILGWNLLFPAAKKEPPAKPPVAGETAGSATAPPAAPPMGMPTAEAPSAAAAQQPAQQIVLSFPGKFDATFSSRGGTLVSWKLADKRFERDATKGELLEPGNGAFHVWFRKSKYDLPQNAEWTGTKVSDTEVRYTLSTPQFDVTKTYTVHPDAYLVKLDVKVVAKVPQGDLAPQNLAITSFAYQDPKADTEGSQQVAARVWNSATLRDGGHYQTTIKELFEAPRHESNITWTGFEHPYLLAAYAPHRQGNESVEKYTYAGPWLGLTKDDGMMRTDIVFPTANVKAGDTISRELVAYLGPKNYRELDRANAAAGFSTGITSTIDFGWFGVIGKPMLWLLQQFYEFVGNWGIAIIMLTFVVKMLTLYWTTKSMRSMKAMAALAPQMKALQEKYKDDRQRLQVETMALYKQNSVNPIAGCLPILLQMPVWIALYRMLSNAGELYQAPFIPGWINDLTATDPYHI